MIQSEFSILPSFSSYAFRSGLKITNKTSGAMHAMIVEPFPGENDNTIAFYKVTYGKKKFSYPVTNCMKGILFIGSKEITVESEGKLIKLIEKDYIGTTVHYFDPRANHKKFNFLLSYKPRELSLEEARSKINHLDTNFQIDTAAYNRHGVVVFGKDSKGYAIFWAKPDEANVHRIQCPKTECTKLIDNIFAKSYMSGYDVVNFKKLNGNCFLNREKATEIQL